MELFRDRIDQSEEKSSLFLGSRIEAFFVLNLNQQGSYRARGRDAVPSGGVNGDVPGGLFCDGWMAAGVFSSFLAGGHVVAPGGETRLLSGPPSGANNLLPGRRRCRADLRGVLHPSRINFRSEKICRNEKNVLHAKTALAVRPGCGRRSFAVHNQVVSRCGAPLMFKHRPGVRRGLKSWVCGCFGWEGRQALRRRGGLPSPVFRFGKFAPDPKCASYVGPVRTSAVFSLLLVGGGV